MTLFHVPVLAREIVELLNVKEGDIIVDCTLGGGGHVESFKKQYPDSKIIGIDRDEEALEFAKKRLAVYENIDYIHSNFSNIQKVITHPVNGFLFDLGISSHQIDKPERGFSIRSDALLDMRMDKDLKISAYDIVNGFSEENLFGIFKEFAEERFSKRIARAIVFNRVSNDIKTTFELKNIIEKAIPTWKKRESVTRIFQALRIVVNSELENLKKALDSAICLLSPSGRIVVISYHSLEDRIVKMFFKEKGKDGILKIITKKPIIASDIEIKENPRAKSAKLRCAEKN